jgi:hypothetical protein
VLGGDGGAVVDVVVLDVVEDVDDVLVDVVVVDVDVVVVVVVVLAFTMTSPNCSNCFTEKLARVRYP